MPLTVNSEIRFPNSTFAMHTLSTCCAVSQSEGHVHTNLRTSYPQMCGKPTAWRFVHSRATIGAHIEGVVP